MYNDSRGLAEAERIEQVAPRLSPARGAGSGLAKLLFLKRRLRPGPGTLALHQADWLLGYLTGHYGVSDWNNCLKLGLDPQTADWPQWLSRLGPAPVELPRVVAPGTELGQISATAARETRFPEHTLVVAGTTDSTAAVVATGAVRPGDAVTCLGSTLVLKIIGREPLAAPQYGVYSHRFGAYWLIGGASNSGGAVLRCYFDAGEIQRLSATLDPDLPTGLDYYPLPAPGERFPINDGTLQTRLILPQINAKSTRHHTQPQSHEGMGGWSRTSAVNASYRSRRGKTVCCRLALETARECFVVSWLGVRKK